MVLSNLIGQLRPTLEYPMNPEWMEGFTLFNLIMVAMAILWIHIDTVWRNPTEYSRKYNMTMTVIGLLSYPIGFFGSFSLMRYTRIEHGLPREVQMLLSLELIAVLIHVCSIIYNNSERTHRLPTT